MFLEETPCFFLSAILCSPYLFIVSLLHRCFKKVVLPV